MNVKRLSRGFPALLLVAVGFAGARAVPEKKPVSVRVMTVAMAEGGENPAAWTLEGARWVQNEGMKRRFVVPGLPVPVFCNDAGHCLMVTGEGPAQAAASVTAVGVTPQFDLRRTYFLIAGVAGTSPDVGTLGSVAWAEWVVSADSKSEIDVRELPPSFEFQAFRMFCKEPWCEGWPGEIGAYHLNPVMREWAFRLSRDVPLLDSEAATTYRNNYPADAAARRAPAVLKGDTLAGSAYWHGVTLGRWATWWVGRWTGGAGRYAMTNQEDFAILATLSRLAKEERVELGRVMVLRGASNFDRPYPGQNALESMNARTGGLPLALENVYRAGSIVSRHIVKNWKDWENGVPALRELDQAAAESFRPRKPCELLRSVDQGVGATFAN